MTAASPRVQPVTSVIASPPSPTPPPSFDASPSQPATVRPHSQIGPPSATPTPSTEASNISPDRSLDSGRRVVRNVSPGLLARMKFLDKSKVVSSPTLGQDKIGRIPESHIRELDGLHRDYSIRVQRRGFAWSGQHPPLAPQSTGGSLPAMDASPPQGFESDRSSFISTSDRVLPSDSEAGDALEEDTQKYRLPDITKTKSLSHPPTETGSGSDVETSRAPTPPPKDTPRAPETSVLDAADSEGNINVADYFAHRHFSRATSIYTLSRVSFSNQIQQLTSISLPPAASLSSSISAIPTSTAAGRALYEAAGQIKLWMTKAAEVLNGLDAEDDVEWAAVGGREGLEEVDAAITRFEDLVNVYVTAIEELQARPDIEALPKHNLEKIVAQLDEVLRNWKKIKQSLKGIKNQVEIAMEWEELWNVVLGEIGLEIENLSRLVFEMEERRHRAITESVNESAEKFDIAELETIVEDTPRQQSQVLQQPRNPRFSLQPAFTVTSPVSPLPQIEKENSNLLALFARMQPLRASLDFLPMRLSSFQNRALKTFPTACDELTRRKEVLEKQEKKLEADADALREELGEDKWVHSFRQAGSKAVAMWTSLTKSVQKLREAIEDLDEEKLPSRISTYKDKREHYPPSMKRVLQLINIEMKNRSTVNGEIVRIQQDVRSKVEELETDIKEMDAILEDFNTNRKLRDSVSTVLSSRTEQSLSGSVVDTPGTSPASSVVLMSRKSSEYGSSTPARKSRQGSMASSKSSVPANKRYSSLPTAVGNQPHFSRRTSIAASPDTPCRVGSSTPTRAARSSTPSSQTSTDSSKPRWNASTSMRDTIVGHNFVPLSATSPSDYRKTPVTPRSLRSVSSHSAIPIRSPLSHGSSTLSPEALSNARPLSTTPSSQASTAKRLPVGGVQSPSTPARGGPAARTSGSGLSSGAPSSGHRLSGALAEEAEADGPSIEDSPSVNRKQTRPPSAMNSRRISLLPQPKGRTTSTSSAGRESRNGGRKSSLGTTPSLEERPRWRG